MRIALVGMTRLPEPDNDEAPLLAALRDAGIDARVIDWDGDPEEHDPAPFDVCVLRATWNYWLHLDDFDAWLDRAASVSRLVNPLGVVRWNLHKRYLLELEAAGIPVIPTVLVERGAGMGFGDAISGRAWSDVVIKPAISGGSWNTRQYPAGEFVAATRFFDRMIGERDMLVQPFVEDVARNGEVSMIWIDGEITHAVRKAPRFDDDEESVSPCEPEDRHIEFAQRVIEASGQPARFGRVDVVERSGGPLMLSELELIEPSLFFPRSAHGLDRFVEMLKKA